MGANHLAAIHIRLDEKEHLLWYGSPVPHSGWAAQWLVPVVVLALTMSIFAENSWPNLHGGITFLVVAISIAIGSGTVLPWFRGDTVYALTTRRAIRVQGRWESRVESYYLSDITALSVTGRDGFGSVRCACRVPTWEQRKGNIDRQPIFRRIVNPHYVASLIVSVRPELGPPPSVPSPLGTGFIDKLQNLRSRA